MDGWVPGFYLLGQWVRGGVQRHRSMLRYKTHSHELTFKDNFGESRTMENLDTP